MFALVFGNPGAGLDLTAHCGLLIHHLGLLRGCDWCAAFLGTRGNHLRLQVQAQRPQPLSDSVLRWHREGLGRGHADRGVHVPGERGGDLFPLLGAR